MFNFFNHKIDHHDLFSYLLEEYKEYVDSPLSIKSAIICAILSYHLIEWVWYNKKIKMIKIANLTSKDDKTQFSDFRKFIIEDINGCPELKNMKNICNGAKHFILGRYNKKGKFIYKKKSGKNINTLNLTGSFNLGFNNSFNNIDLYIHNNDNKNLRFKNEIKKVVDFWENFFNNYLV